MGKLSEGGVPSYSKQFELLTALVTYMAMDKTAMRQPKWFANQLSTDINVVKAVLGEFKGLFHESVSKSKDYGDSYYSLHLRYARQELDENEKQVRKPLQLEDLMGLLDFISKRAAEETKRNTGITTSIIAAVVVVFSSLTTVLVALTR
jgi:hypothetical protein